VTPVRDPVGRADYLLPSNDYLLISPCRRRMLPRPSLVMNALAGIDVLTIRLNRAQERARG